MSTQLPHLKQNYIATFREDPNEVTDKQVIEFFAHLIDARGALWTKEDMRRYFNIDKNEVYRAIKDLKLKPFLTSKKPKYTSLQVVLVMEQLGYIYHMKNL